MYASAPRRAPLPAPLLPARARMTTKCILKFVLQKSIPTKIRQFVLYISNSTGQVDGFVGESTSAK